MRSDTNRSPSESISRSILILRGHRVILDSDLAAPPAIPSAHLICDVLPSWSASTGGFFAWSTAEYAAALNRVYSI